MDCKRCGQCCIEAPITIGILTDTNKTEIMDRINWLNYHHCKTVIHPDNSIKVWIPLTCTHLDYSGEEYSCKIYESRPELCKNFKCSRG